jgi:hypothetical protein
MGLGRANRRGQTIEKVFNKNSQSEQIPPPPRLCQNALPHGERAIHLHAHGFIARLAFPFAHGVRSVYNYRRILPDGVV